VLIYLLIPPFPPLAVFALPAYTLQGIHVKMHKQGSDTTGVSRLVMPMFALHGWNKVGGSGCQQ